MRIRAKLNNVLASDIFLCTSLFRVDYVLAVLANGKLSIHLVFPINMTSHRATRTCMHAGCGQHCIRVGNKRSYRNFSTGRTKRLHKDEQLKTRDTHHDQVICVPTVSNGASAVECRSANVVCSILAITRYFGSLDDTTGPELYAACTRPPPALYLFYNSHTKKIQSYIEVARYTQNLTKAQREKHKASAQSYNADPDPHINMPSTN